MSEDVQNANGTKLTTDPHERCQVPFTLHQKHSHLTRSHWTSSQSFQSHRGLIPSSLSPITTVPKCRVSSPDKRKLMQKKLQLYMLSTYSPLPDFPLRSLVTETLVSPHDSQGNCVTFWASNRTSLWRTTPTLTDNQNRQTNGWNNTSISGQMNDKITGPLISLWRNSLTTIGQMRPHVSPLSSF